MASIARRNLFSDKIRLAITLVGITFAVVLMVGQVGAYLGFMNSASQLIDYSNVDIWMTAKNTINFDSAKPFPERKINKVKEARGVLWVDKIAQTWGLMKLKNGGTESVQIIGINPEKDVGIPWKIKAGSIKDLKVGTSIMVDESSLDRLGGLKVGDEVEIFKKRAKVVGITEEIKSFTTYPVIFTSYKLSLIHI